MCVARVHGVCYENLAICVHPRLKDPDQNIDLNFIDDIIMIHNYNSTTEKMPHCMKPQVHWLKLMRCGNSYIGRVNRL